MNTSTTSTATTTWFLLFLTLAVILRVLLFSGFVGGDDSAYAVHAYLLSIGEFVPPQDHWGLRSLPVLLTAVSFKLFGVGPLSMAVFPLLFSLLAVVLAFKLGELLFDQKTGLMAALLTAIFPMEVIFATHVFPYAFMSALCALSLYLFLRAEASSRGTLYFLAGASLGAAYLARETALFCLLFFGLYCVWQRRFRFTYVYFLLGLVVLVAVEMAYFQVVTGDPLYRVHTLAGFSIERADAAASKPAPAVKSAGRPLQWYVEPFVRPFFEQEVGLYFAAFLLAAIVALINRPNHQCLILLLWIVPIYLYTVYGTISPFQYHPLRRLPRYMSPVIIPMLVLIAYQITALSKPALRRAAIALLAVSSALSLLIDDSPHATQREQRIAAHAGAAPKTRFVIPRTLMFEVALHSGFEALPQATLFERPNDASHGLKRIKAVMPELPSVSPPLDLACGTQVFADGGYLSRADLPVSAVPVAHFEQTRTFKQWLLSHPLTLKILALVRDPRRLRDLRKSGADDVVLYEIQC